MGVEHRAAQTSPATLASLTNPWQTSKWNNSPLKRLDYAHDFYFSTPYMSSAQSD